MSHKSNIASEGTHPSTVTSSRFAILGNNTGVCLDYRQVGGERKGERRPVLNGQPAPPPRDGARGNRPIKVRRLSVIYGQPVSAYKGRQPEVTPIADLERRAQGRYRSCCSNLILREKWWSRSRVDNLAPLRDHHRARVLRASCIMGPRTGHTKK